MKKSLFLKTKNFIIFSKPKLTFLYFPMEIFLIRYDKKNIHKNVTKWSVIVSETIKNQALKIFFLYYKL